MGKMNSRKRAVKEAESQFSIHKTIADSPPKEFFDSQSNRENNICTNEVKNVKNTIFKQGKCDQIEEDIECISPDIKRESDVLEKIRTNANQSNRINKIEEEIDDLF